MEKDIKEVIYEIGSKYSNYSKQGSNDQPKRDVSALLQEILNQQNNNKKESE